MKLRLRIEQQQVLVRIQQMKKITKPCADECPKRILIKKKLATDDEKFKKKRLRRRLKRLTVV